jgi:hypothetical protein
MRLRLGVPILLAMVSVATIPAAAHRSGCHRWHSCPSDHGTYVCGDLGYCSQCADNQYCEAGQPRRTPATSKKPTTQQEKAKVCDAEAVRQGLTGNERRAFVTACLRR